MSDENDKDKNKKKSKGPKLTVLTPNSPPPKEIKTKELTPSMSDEDLNDLIGIMDPRAIETLDLAALREKMLKSIFILQAGLWGQAGFESNRLANNRKLTASLEKELFDPAKIEQMNPEQKIRLYQIIQNNMNNSLNFFQNLHASVNTGIDTLSKMEKLKSERPKSSQTDKSDSEKTSLQDIRANILNKIKDKTTKGSNK